MSARANFSLLLMLLMFSLPSSAQQYKQIKVSAPFKMPKIKEYVFPSSTFDIRDYGAKEGDVASNKSSNIMAFRQAMEACASSGGGHVVVPRGDWYTGPIHFKDNVDLRLEEGAHVIFSDDPSDYLPAVATSWEGMECYNYSPLLYAYECKNIGISGSGTLAPKMDNWRKWFSRPQPHMEASARLYHSMSKGEPVESRQMATGEEHFRPHLIQFNRCKNIVLDGFKIRESPFWTIHLYMCKNGVVRNLDVYAHGHNNDGIDLEMSQNILVENCKFDQGDDAVVIKSGRNQDAWRLHTPTKNVVVRNCNIVNGHVLLGIGSELSGGVKNVYMTNCKVSSKVLRVFFVKTNERRGGVIENIYMDNCTAEAADRMFEIDTDVLYQWAKLPTYEVRRTKIRNLYMTNVYCNETKGVYEIKGDSECPIKNVTLKNVKAGNVTEFEGKSVNCDGLRVD